MSPANPTHTQSGVTLVEVLIALVVGSIVVVAAFGSYQIVQRIHAQSQNLASIHSAGREALRLLSRDLKMAGFVSRENLSFSPLPRTIPAALTVSSDQPLSCGGASYSNDYLVLLYDDMERARSSGSDQRRRITYQIGCDSGRLQLQQQIEISSGGAFTTTQSMSPLVDDIGNLQFTFYDRDGVAAQSPDNQTVERVEVRFSVYGMLQQQGRSDSSRLVAGYRSTIFTCNLGCET